MGKPPMLALVFWYPNDPQEKGKTTVERKSVLPKSAHVVGALTKLTWEYKDGRKEVFRAKIVQFGFSREQLLKIRIDDQGVLIPDDQRAETAEVTLMKKEKSQQKRIVAKAKRDTAQQMNATARASQSIFSSATPGSFLSPTVSGVNTCNNPSPSTSGALSRSQVPPVGDPNGGGNVQSENGNAEEPESDSLETIALSDIVQQHCSGSVIVFTRDFIKLLSLNEYQECDPSDLLGKIMEDMQKMFDFDRPKSVKLDPRFFFPGDDKVQLHPSCNFYFSSVLWDIIEERCPLKAGWNRFVTVVLTEVYGDNLPWITAVGQGTTATPVHPELYRGLYAQAKERSPGPVPVSTKLFNKAINQAVYNRRTKLKAQIFGKDKTLCKKRKPSSDDPEDPSVALVKPNSDSVVLENLGESSAMSNCNLSTHTISQLQHGETHAVMTNCYPSAHNMLELQRGQTSAADNANFQQSTLALTCETIHPVEIGVMSKTESYKSFEDGTMSNNGFSPVALQSPPPEVLRWLKENSGAIPSFSGPKNVFCQFSNLTNNLAY